jgi:alginate O-acetyltransferase complex protein AlgI
MLFHSFEFLVFFCVVFAVFWTLRNHRTRMGWLLIASCVFYGSWNPWLVGLILFTAGVDYVIARRLMEEQAPRRRRVLLILSIGMSIGLLAYFKYAVFLAENAVLGLNALGGDFARPMWSIVLPLGISFYTFETISYVVDVYRRRIPAARNVLDYALYIMFFPHLIAGPIVRPGYLLRQIRRARCFNWARLQLGAQFFLRGLFKKAVLADHLAAVVDPVFKDPAAYSSGTLWLATVCYAAQIYCDFSGYTDMAIGTAHAFGFRLPRNFNLPYFASSIADFWRRWHITLATWMRDYVYIPLGGSRISPARTYFNIIVTFALCGLWHGAAWQFLVFGLYHGVLLSLERALPLSRRFDAPVFQPLKIARTFVLLCIGLVIFRAHALPEGFVMLGRMLSPASGEVLSAHLVALGTAIVAVVFAGHLVGTFLPRSATIARRAPPALVGFALASFFLLIQLLMPAKSAIFVYFQF